MEYFVNRLQATLTTAPGVTGSFVIGAALPGLRRLLAEDSGREFAVTVVEGNNWEVRRGCIYTHATSTLSRGSLEASSSGSAITFTQAATLMVSVTGGQLNELVTRIQVLEAGGGSGSSIPVNITVPVISDALSMDQTLTTTNGTWSGASGVYTYQWRRNNIDVAGATLSTYLLTTADIGYQISVRVTSTSTAGSASAASANTATIPIDTRPRHGIALPGAYSNPVSLLASLTDKVIGSVNNGKSGTFTVITSGGNYGWLAVVAGSSVAGVTFTQGLIFEGGWSGAGFIGNNTRESPSPTLSPPNPVLVTPTGAIVPTYTDGNGTVWRFFRQDYAASAIYSIA